MLQNNFHLNKNLYVVMSDRKSLALFTFGHLWQGTNAFVLAYEKVKGSLTLEF